jgi:NAD(P)-dependent dehydrogenase (short-subunit alcohol dehydrogenase family)
VVANATRPSTVRLLKTVSDEYVRYGITINTVAPGWIETHNAIEYIDKNIGLHTEQQRRDYMLNTAGVPAARMGKPAEIASLVAYLCSEESKSMEACTGPRSSPQRDAGSIDLCHRRVLLHQLLLVEFAGVGARQLGLERD